MQVGIFTNTFDRSTLKETLDAVKAHGLEVAQFNLECAGVPYMPDRIEGELCDTIRREMASRGMVMAAVSGTFNMIHPDLEERRRGMRRLRELASACKRLDTPVITLCTGTRNPDSMWHGHPENGSPEAWRDLLVSMGEASEIAEENGVTVAFEPEVANVVDSAQKARRLLDEVRSAHLKVVIDGANIFHAGELSRMREILDEAFALLGEAIVHAHAKDLDHDGEAGKLAAGTGLLDYDHYLSLLHKIGFDGPLILHGLEEKQVNASRDFLLEKLTD